MAKGKASKTEVGHARKLGLDPDRLLRIRNVIEEDTARGLYDGAVFIVARHGEIVLHEAVAIPTWRRSARPARTMSSSSCP